MHEVALLQCLKTPCPFRLLLFLRCTRRESSSASDYNLHKVAQAPEWGEFRGMGPASTFGRSRSPVLLLDLCTEDATAKLALVLPFDQAPARTRDLCQSGCIPDEDVSPFHFDEPIPLE
jgi:hypothetical protein